MCVNCKCNPCKCGGSTIIDSEQSEIFEGSGVTFGEKSWEKQMITEES